MTHRNNTNAQPLFGILDSFQPTGMTVEQSRRLYGPSRLIDQTMSWISILLVSTLLASAIILLLRRIGKTNVVKKEIKTLSHAARLRKKLTSPFLIRIKKRILRSKRFVLASITLILLSLAILGSIFPISKAHSDVCGNSEIKRLSIIRKELGEYLDIKSQTDGLNELIKRVDIALSCKSVKQAELYIF